MEFRSFSHLKMVWNGIPRVFLFREMVRNGIPRVCSFREMVRNGIPVFLLLETGGIPTELLSVPSCSVLRGIICLSENGNPSKNTAKLKTTRARYLEKEIEELVRWAKQCWNNNKHRWGMFAETTIVDYHLSFASQIDKLRFSVTVRSKPNGSLQFLFSVCRKHTEVLVYY